MGSVGEETQKVHIVCLPYPSQGHITPFMQLAKLLHSNGFHITFVMTEYNHKRFVRNKGPDSVKGLPDFRFETIPDGLPPSDKDVTQDIPTLNASMRKTCLAPFKELMVRVNSCCEVPPISCIISDGVMGFGSRAARELGIPEIQFWTASACGFIGYLQYPQLVKRGIVPFKDDNFMYDGTLDTPIDWIPGMKNVRLRDLPSFMRVTDANDIMFDYLGSESQNCLKSSAIIINIFDEFERDALEVISTMSPNVYTIGPLKLLEQHYPESKLLKSLTSNLWKEDTKCLEWLDTKKPESVIYVNYGSITTMTEDNLKEFAWGLANSKLPFLWVVRSDVVKGDSTILPNEFIEEIKDRGYIANWCPQEQVLGHPSVGAYLTHCGWNSMVETVSAGIPVICWPFFAEQQTNCRYACTSNWGTGMEVSPDVKRGEIELLVREMLEGDEGRKMRNKAKEWKKKAIESCEIGGSSYNNFERLIKEGLQFGG